MQPQQFRFDRLRPEIQEQVWNDASWTKAIFIRDPAERVLSAYLDKVVQTHETQRKPRTIWIQCVICRIHWYSLVGWNSTWHQRDTWSNDWTIMHVRPSLATTGLVVWSLSWKIYQSLIIYIGTSLDNAAALHSKGSIVAKGKHVRNVWQALSGNGTRQAQGLSCSSHVAAYPPDDASTSWAWSSGWQLDSNNK
jgi:hypothetical protein